MYKAFIKLIFFIATFIIVFVPVVSLFFGNKSHAAVHLIGNDRQCHQEHVGHADHDNSWLFIKNKHLVTPRPPLKIRAAAIISLFLVSCFLGISLIIKNHLLVHCLAGTKPFPVSKRFLVCRMLLI
ncbi:MAG TPA: hypothetical protein VGC01_10835 [Mucilaginibacter sp.]